MSSPTTSSSMVKFDNRTFIVLKVDGSNFDSWLQGLRLYALGNQPHLWARIDPEDTEVVHYMEDAKNKAPKHAVLVGNTTTPYKQVLQTPAPTAVKPEVKEEDKPGIMNAYIAEVRAMTLISQTVCEALRPQVFAAQAYAMLSTQFSKASVISISSLYFSLINVKATPTRIYLNSSDRSKKPATHCSLATNA